MRARNMLKMIMSFVTVSLLAITLATTTAHSARLDKSLNSAAEDQEVHSGPIPYTECMETCDHCACTKIWPPEANWCLCSNDSVAKKAIAAIKSFKKPVVVAVQQVPKVKSLTMSAAECAESCKGVCGCTVIPYPHDPVHCFCFDTMKSAKSKKQAIPGVDEKKMVLWTEAKMVGISVEECLNTCEETCVCTNMPFQTPTCSCITIPPQSQRKSQAIQKSVEKTTGEFIPYLECIVKCARCTPCTMNLPIWKSRCVCQMHTTSVNSNKKAIQNSGGDDKKMVLWTEAKMVGISVEECINTCEETCVCTNMPFQTPSCSCITIPPSHKKSQTAAGGGALPM